MEEKERERDGIRVDSGGEEKRGEEKRDKKREATLFFVIVKQPYTNLVCITFWRDAPLAVTLMGPVDSYNTETKEERTNVI